jgi:hypothetical protein
MGGEKWMNRGHTSANGHFTPNTPVPASPPQLPPLPTSGTWLKTKPQVKIVVGMKETIKKYRTG